MTEPRTILDQLGIDGVETIETMTGGADAVLYRLRRDDESLALRVLGPTQAPQAANENRFLDHATSHGIAGPHLIATGFVNGCPVSVMTWIEGQALATRLLSNPDHGDLAEQFAAWQQRIHALPLPEQREPSIVWRHMVPDELIAALEHEPPRPPAVVHLDYHPFNCMARDDEIVAVLDWANAGIADPRYDVARTLAILTHAPVPDASMRQSVAAFRHRYLAAYGGDPLPPVFRWWAGVTMLADLLPKRGHPSLGWLTETWIDGVTTWTDAARQEALRSA